MEAARVEGCCAHCWESELFSLLHNNTHVTCTKFCTLTGCPPQAHPQLPSLFPLPCFLLPSIPQNCSPPSFLFALVLPLSLSSSPISLSPSPPPSLLLPRCSMHSTTTTLVPFLSSLPCFAAAPVLHTEARHRHQPPPAQHQGDGGEVLRLTAGQRSSSSSKPGLQPGLLRHI